jgi:hypothetical protein
MNLMTNLSDLTSECSDAKNSLRHNKTATTPSTTPQIRVPRVVDLNEGLR